MKVTEQAGCEQQQQHKSQFCNAGGEWYRGGELSPAAPRWLQEAEDPRGVVRALGRG